MSEWITFGQMIDKLKVGEVAENEYGNQYAKSTMGGIGPIKDPEENIFVNGTLVKSKWRILPKYVSFEEAMAVVKSKTNKSVFWHYEGQKIHVSKYTMFDTIMAVVEDEDLSIPRFDDLFIEKWSIEEDEQ